MASLQLATVMTSPSSSERPTSTSSPRGAALSVLVVDREPGVRRVIERLMSRRGYETRTASTAEDALAILRETPCDLLLTEVHLSGEADGPRLASMAAETCPGIRILYMTGYLDGSMSDRGIDHVVLTKPFGSDQLHRVVDDLMGNGEGPRPSSARQA